MQRSQTTRSFTSLQDKRKHRKNSLTGCLPFRRSKSVRLDQESNVDIRLPEDPTFRGTGTIRSMPADRLGQVLVQLYKREGSNLGLTVSGGSDRGEAPVIASIRPGSIADRSDCLLVNDHILAINGVETVSLRHEEIVRLVKSSGPHILLEVEYILPDNPSNIRQSSAKRTQVTLERDGGESFGFTVRGGACQEMSRFRPITVMHVRPGSSAERDGRVKAGDRLLTINGRPSDHMSCEEAMGLMRATEFELQLYIEYDVAVDGTLARRSSGPVVVEIRKQPSERLGVSLAPYHDPGDLDIFYIDNIREGSIADRCGLVQLGDKVVSIDDFKVDHMTLQEAMHRIKSNVSESIRLEIIPDDSFDVDKMTGLPQVNGIPRAKSMPSGVSTLGYMHTNEGGGQCSCHMGAHPSAVHTTQQQQQQQLNSMHQPTHVPCPVAAAASRVSMLPDSGSGLPDVFQHGGAVPDCSNPMERSVIATSTSTIVLDPALRRLSITKSTTSLHSVAPGNTGSGFSRPDQIDVTLTVDDMGSFGFTLKGQSHSPTAALTEYPIVEYVQPGGPAHQCSVIQEHDRLISVNNIPTIGRSLDEVNSQILSCGRTVVLVIQFNVADTVVPSSGVFNVKLVKRCESLGINLQAVIGPRRQGQPLLITKVTHAGVAYRSGSIQAGDLLLAVNNVLTESCTLGEAVALLQDSEDVVTLRIQKEDKNSTVSEDSEGPVAMQVEIIRSHPTQPWGLVISGQDDTPAPPYVFVDSLTPGCPVEANGQLAPGDLLLGINGVSLQGRTLAHVRQMLQQPINQVLITFVRPASGRPRASGQLRLLNGKTKVQTTPRLFGISSFGDTFSSKKLDTLSHQTSFPPMHNPGHQKIPSTDSAVDLPEGPTESDSDSHPSLRGQYHNNPNHQGQLVPTSVIMTTSCQSSIRPTPLHATFDPRVRIIHATHEGGGGGGGGGCGPHHNQHGHANQHQQQCPGCKEAVDNEMKQQQQLMQIQQKQQELQQKIEQHFTHQQQQHQQQQHQQHQQQQPQLQHQQQQQQQQQLQHQQQQPQLQHQQQQQQHQKQPQQQQQQQQQHKQQKQQQPEHIAQLRPKSITSLPKVHGGAIPINMPSHASVRNSQKLTADSKLGQPPVSSDGSVVSTTDGAVTNGGYSSPQKSVTTNLSPEEQAELESQIFLRNNSTRSCVRLTRVHTTESFGIGVSDGLSPKGVFVSAVRENSPAQSSGQIQVFDRILKVNDSDVEGSGCSEVVTLISRSGNILDLVLQRRKHPLSVSYSQFNPATEKQMNCPTSDHLPVTSRPLSTTAQLYVDTSCSN